MMLLKRNLYYRKIFNPEKLLFIRRSFANAAHLDAIPSTCNEEQGVQQKQSHQELAENQTNITLVPQRLHEHLFGSESLNDAVKTQMADGDCIEDKLMLPELKTQGLMKHFRQLGNEQFKDYKDLMEIALEMKDLPKMPLNKWVIAPGWTAYDGKNGRAVPFPDEKLLFFDVEVCMNDGKLPTMAVALSPTKWYSWCSERLVDETVEVPEFADLRHMIPMEGPERMEKKLVIGHNVGFDRQFVREQYELEQSAMRFWCTMSMHIACAGMADHQRNLYEKSKLNARDFMLAQIMEDGPDGIPKITPKFQKLIESWKTRTSKNSLLDVHKRYCGQTSGMHIEKENREFFTKQDIPAIRENAQKLFTYCANDVFATFEVFQKLYPIFQKRFPHPITYCGMLEMANAYLPITGNWRRFYTKCENITSTSKNAAAKCLIESAREIIEDLDKEGENNRKKYESDPWMWVSDWKRKPKSPKWPLWYSSIFKKPAYANDSLEALDAQHIKLYCREIPRIFGLCFGPYPLLFKPKDGWGFLVHSGEGSVHEDFMKVKLEEDGEEVDMPVKSIFELIQQNSINMNDVITQKLKPLCKLGIFDFYKLPHPSGTDKNVGTPFAKSSQMNFDNFETEVFSPTRYSHVLKCFRDTQTKTRFWGNYRDRFNEQLAVWLDEQREQGAIVPSITPAGTVTRRAVHKLWLTSANPKKEIVGSDLKSMVQCTDGWYLVGADVDSQEQWIAALFGDSMHENRRAGATPFSNMLLAGDKATQTDLHSVVAKQVGISRDHAKVLNYARLYGSGNNHAENYLRMQGIPSYRAKELTTKLFDTTKGKKTNVFELTNIGFEQLRKASRTMEINQKEKLLRKMLTMGDRHFINAYISHDEKICGKLLKDYKLSLNDLVISGNQLTLYHGGYESHTFNFLSLASTAAHPKTPILKCQLSSALEPFEDRQWEAYTFNKMYKRTIVNWFVQSSAVDFLHMLLVCMRWLCTQYKINARFVISIHDEVRYLVPEEDRYRCALALTLSNMYVRAAISEALGIKELPRSIAFFSQVDIDTVLRKEVNMDCETPDGKTIPHGEALRIEQIIEKTGGSLERTGQQISPSSKEDQ